MTRLVVIGWPIVLSVGLVVGVRIHRARRHRAELERRRQIQLRRVERQAAARMASEIRNARRRATAEQAEQVHDKVQRWLTDALRVREAGLVEQFRKELEEL